MAQSQVRFGRTNNAGPFGVDSRDPQVERTSGKAPYDWRDPDARGINSVGAGLAGMLSDTGRNLGNFGGELARWLQGMGPSGPGQGAGDFYFGRGDVPLQGSGLSRGRALGRVREKNPQEQAKTFADFLAEAERMLSGSGMDFDGERARLNKTHSDIDARIESMYRALQGNIDSRTSEIGGFYSSANEGVQKSAESAAQTIGNAYDSIRASRAEELAKLGLQEGATQGSDLMAQDQLDQVANLQAGGQSSQNLNSTLGANAQTFNTQSGLASLARGQEDRFANQMALSNNLASLGRQQAQSGAGSIQEKFQIAQMLQQMEQGVPLSADDQYRLAQLTQGDREFAYQQEQDQRQLFLDLLERTGNDPQKAIELWVQMQSAMG